MDKNTETPKFIKYQGKISIPVPSGGRYFLEKVDIDSFKVLDSQDYSDRSTLIVGLDKNSVYFEIFVFLI